MRTTVAGTFLLAWLACSSVSAQPAAKEILEASGFQGGLIVHIGCGQAELTTALRNDDSTIVQGLDTNPTNIQQARARIQSLKLGGSVSADLFDGQHLPYVDELVNLVVAGNSVAENGDKIAMAEVMRVLRPGGVAYVQQGGTWSKTVKPWPRDIDQWTHYLYDSQGESVSHDRIVGNPKGLRWTGGPLWARSHEHTASMQAMVSAGGRVFYVLDEGPIDSIQLPSNFVLTARDAFNGVVLWKRPLHDWINALFPLKSGPGWMPRRLVAVGDKVFVAAGVGHNLLCLDAATGKVLCDYKETATTFELIVSNEIVFAAVDPNEKPWDYRQEDANCWKERERASRRWGWRREQGKRVIKAMQVETGELLWQRETPLAPMTLSADGRMVCFYDGSAVVAVDQQTGKDLWTADVSDMRLVPTGYSGPRLVIHQDKVLFSPPGQIFAINAETGEVIWSVDGKPRSGHFSLEDFYVIGDKVWVLGRGNAGVYKTYSLQDGKELEDHRNPIRSFYIHQRCYPGRATERVQLAPMMGVLVYDMDQDTWTNNHWIRGGCFYGVMPANGMIYTPPNACACYYQSRLNGFNAVAPQPQPSVAPPVEQRLVKGPAYGLNDRGQGDGQSDTQTEYTAADWPAFRHDNGRSGYVRTDVAADVRPTWKRDFGTKLSQPVAADGRLLISAVEAQAVYALDATSGQQLWRFDTGGRVDSPPTLHQGLAIFGCADGCVYAVCITNGELAWKFQVAPTDRQLVSYDQLESVWPLAGSVLIEQGKLYCVAGRSMFLDGGLRMVVLDPDTGRLLAENVMDRQTPDGQHRLDDLLMGKHMPVAMPDILSSDGQYVYMKSQTFTLDGKRLRIVPQRPDTQYDREVHLFAPISFLDDGWHQRAYWIYGRAAGEGWAEFQLPPKRVPCGRILCLDETNAYGYARDPELLCNTSVSEYRLYSAGKIPTRKVAIPKLEGTWVKSQVSNKDTLAAHSVDWKRLAQQPPERLSALDYDWIHDEPTIMAKAMVLANDRLFVAGPRDVVDEKAMWGRSNAPAYQKKMAQQAAWLRGQYGGVLQVFAKSDGQKLAELDLEHLPAFDGMIAANGSLYIATLDGSIVCYRGK